MRPHDLVGEFCDDGHSAARLDRPGLDALHDSEAGDRRRMVPVAGPVRPGLRLSGDRDTIILGHDHDLRGPDEIPLAHCSWPCC
jgi:hypothetical protein